MEKHRDVFTDYLRQAPRLANGQRIDWMSKHSLAAKFVASMGSLATKSPTYPKAVMGNKGMEGPRWS